MRPSAELPHSDNLRVGPPPHVPFPPNVQFSFNSRKRCLPNIRHQFQVKKKNGEKLNPKRKTINRNRRCVNFLLISVLKLRKVIHHQEIRNLMNSNNN